MLNYDDCNGQWEGVLRRKCARCTRQRHTCEPLEHQQLIPLLNPALRARDELAARTRDDEEGGEGGKEEEEEEDEDEGAPLAGIKQLVTYVMVLQPCVIQAH